MNKLQDANRKRYRPEEPDSVLGFEPVYRLPDEVEFTFFYDNIETDMHDKEIKEEWWG